MCEHSLLSICEHQSGWFCERDSYLCVHFFVHSPVEVDIFNAGTKGEPSRKDSSVNSETLR